jgi:hypothetical protein
MENPIRVGYKAKLNEKLQREKKGKLFTDYEMNRQSHNNEQ